MKTVNKIILLGYLGADAEVRYTTGADARAIAKFSIATRESGPTAPRPRTIRNGIAVWLGTN
jgi:single-stranded DNA-binding protein